jgi:hypothetical protein
MHTASPLPIRANIYIWPNIAKILGASGGR